MGEGGVLSMASSFLSSVVHCSLESRLALYIVNGSYGDYYLNLNLLQMSGSRFMTPDVNKDLAWFSPSKATLMPAEDISQV